MNNILNPIFRFIAQNEPLVQAISTTYSVAKNYQRDKKISLHDEEIKYIKSVLGLTTYELTDNQLKIIDIFLVKSEEENKNLNRIEAYFNELKEKININEQELNNELQELESENFIAVNSDFKEYKLSYDIFINSDLVYKLYKKSTDYYVILNMVIDFLLEINANSKYTQVNVEKFIEKNSLNYFFMNPIMYHLKKNEIIEYEESLQPKILLDSYFYFEGNAKLLKLKKLLVLKDK
jgi:hypothetical protein